MKDWNNLADITRASFGTPAETRVQKAAPAIAHDIPSQTLPRKPLSVTPSKLPGGLENPRIVEALMQLQRRRQQALGSGSSGPKVLNSHARSCTDLPLQTAKIHPPRKPHG